MGVGFGKLAGKSLEPGLGSDRLRRCMAADRAIDDNECAELRVLAGLGIEARAEFRLHDGKGGAAIGEIELQQVRGRQRINQKRHKACAHRTEESGRIGRRVVEEEQHAVAALQAQGNEGMAPAAGLRAKLGIGLRPGRSGQRQPLAKAFGEIVEENPARIVALRDLEADFARAGAIPRNAIGDLRRQGLRHHDAPPSSSRPHSAP